MKRIKRVNSDPNPLFLQWLKEFREEAKQKENSSLVKIYSMCIEKEQRDSVGMCLQGRCVCVLPLCMCWRVFCVLSLVCFISLYCKIDVAHCGTTCLSSCTWRCACVCVCVCVCAQ